MLSHLLGHRPPSVLGSGHADLMASVPWADTNSQPTARRMDPLIAEFPNQTWYHGRLLNGPRAAAPVEVRAALRAVKWPAGRAHQPVVFVDVPHGAEETTPSGSKINYSEACTVVQCLRVRDFWAGISPGLPALSWIYVGTHRHRVIPSPICAQIWPTSC